MPLGVVNRITIRSFVLGSFAVLLLVALTAVLVPVRSAIDADRHIQQIEHDVIPRLVQLDHIKTAVTGARQHMAKALIDGSPERHSAETTATREAIMEADRLIQRYRDTIREPQEQALFVPVEAAWHEWKAAREGVLRLTLRDYAAAAALYQVDAPRVGENVGSAVDALIRHQQGRSMAVARAEAHNIRQAVRLAVGLGAVMVAVAGLIIACLLQRVTTPLVRLADAMRAMAQGALDHAIPGAQRSDEIGAISQALHAIKRLVAQKVREKANQELAVQRRLAEQAREEERKREVVIDRISCALSAMAKGDLAQAQPNLPAEYERISRDFETTIGQWLQAQDAVEYLASHDTLTGLGNRSLARRVLDETLADEPPYCALVAFEIDRLATINKVFGPPVGDDILREVADILRHVAHPQDVVCRVAGNEFCIIQRMADGPEDTRRLVAAVAEAMAARWDVARDPSAVALSTGIATYPCDGHSPETLKSAVVLALDRARQSGRGQICFFDSAMDASARASLRLEADLAHALARQQFHLDFQPIVDPATHAVQGYEALLRWCHPDLGAIAPGEFIPLAEASGAIVTIGEWVLQQACLAASQWSGDAFVAVNISPVQLQVLNLPDIVASTLRQTGLAPARLELEITESALIANRDGALAILEQIRALGVHISMDDFGTGYSSLSNLQSFPFSKLKIDQSFVARALTDAKARSIIRAVVGLGRSLGLPVLAEGVETESQRQLVMEEGCDEAQGYLFGRAATPGQTTPEQAAAPEQAKRA
ncbi:EAL domain-containing protein [Novosphingobium sp. SG720]|uniref:EAL domain-containing protein n=1 Tax=Novosphingobium sp. SG720 TaxID=2586998 RepID=UPI001447609C